MASFFVARFPALGIDRPIFEKVSRRHENNRSATEGESD